MKKERIRAAHHEAGHCVVGYLLTKKIPNEVNIIKTKERLGMNKSDNSRSFKKMLDGIDNYEFTGFETEYQFVAAFKTICCMLGGGVAEMMYCGLKRLPKNGMAGDYESVFEIGHRIFPVRFTKTGTAYYPALESLIETCIHFLKGFVQGIDVGNKITVIANALLEKEKLKRRELKDLLKD